MALPIGTGRDTDGTYSEQSDGWYRAQEITKRLKAEDSSAMLLERCNALYRRFAEKHRLPLEIARDLQLRGYRP